MNLRQSFNVCFLKKYATASGRASKSEFWWFMMVFLLTMGVPFNISMITGTIAGSMVNVGTLLLLIPVLTPFVAALPLICVGIRRLHDSGRSGKYMFLNFIPVIGSIILLDMMAKDSDSHDNKYGPVTQDTENAENGNLKLSAMELKDAVKVLTILNVIAFFPLLLINVATWTLPGNKGIMNIIFFKSLILEFPCIISLIYVGYLYWRMKKKSWITALKAELSSTVIYFFIGIIAAICGLSSFFLLMS